MRNLSSFFSLILLGSVLDTLPSPLIIASSAATSLQTEQTIEQKEDRAFFSLVLVSGL